MLIFIADYRLALCVLRTYSNTVFYKNTKVDRCGGWLVAKASTSRGKGGGSLAQFWCIVYRASIFYDFDASFLYLETGQIHSFHFIWFTTFDKFIAVSFGDGLCKMFRLKFSIEIDFSWCDGYEIFKPVKSVQLWNLSNLNNLEKIILFQKPWKTWETLFGSSRYPLIAHSISSLLLTN